MSAESGINGIASESGRRQHAIVPEGTWMNDRLKRSVVIACAIAMAPGVLWYVLVPHLTWDGGIFCRFMVTVVDGQTLEPIADSTVALCLSEEIPGGLGPACHDRRITAAKTDRSGKSTIGALCGAGGTSGPFGRSGRVTFTGHWLQVSADGHETLTAPLGRYTGQVRSIRRSRDIEITVRLHRPGK